MKIVYTGAAPIEIPGLGMTDEHAWPPGEAREVPDVYAERWLADAEAPYARPGTKAAREAAGTGESTHAPPASEESGNQPQEGGAA